MKRIVIGLATLAVFAVPMLSYAQNTGEVGYQNTGEVEYYDQGPPPYNDVEDGQILKLASYILMPVGWALEHGLTRPLHSLATNSAAAPVLSGDTQIRYFGESSNANLLPPDTFRPFLMPANPTQMDTSVGPLVTTSVSVSSSVLPPVAGVQTTTTRTVITTTPNSYSNSTGQSVIH
jgi:hypothetical protein